MTKELIERMIKAWRESFCDLEEDDPTPTITYGFQEAFEAGVNAAIAEMSQENG